MVAGLLAALLAVTPLRDVPDLPPGVRVVVIGSSMTGHAVPVVPPPGGLLGDGRAHARWQAGAITEARTLDLLEAAVAAGAETVLVEVNTFATMRRDAAARREGGVAAWIDGGLEQLTRRLQASLSALGGRAELPVNRNDPDLDPRPWSPRLDGVARIYPEVLTQPRDPSRLRALLDRASAGGVEVLFFDPPRPEAVAAAMGPDGYAAFLAHLRSVAGAYDTSLLVFETPWPDNLFRDPVHMNRDGRARFLAELPLLWGALR
jgi:hypothetical protein